VGTQEIEIVVDGYILKSARHLRVPKKKNYLSFRIYNKILTHHLNIKVSRFNFTYNIRSNPHTIKLWVKYDFSIFVFENAVRFNLTKAVKSKTFIRGHLF